MERAGPECPICLNSIPLPEEAFLDNCFHRFHLTCIQRWTRIQKTHPAPAPDGLNRQPRITVTCPMCRQAYKGIIHTCVDTSFRVEWVDSEAGRNQLVAVGAQLQLSAPQRRRRSRYTTGAATAAAAGMATIGAATAATATEAAAGTTTTHAAAAATGAGAAGTTAAGAAEAGPAVAAVATLGTSTAGSNTAGAGTLPGTGVPLDALAPGQEGSGARPAGSETHVPGNGALERENGRAAPGRQPVRHASQRPRTARRVSNPLVEVWVTRELQALLLEEDVQLVVAAALGAISSTAPANSTTRTAGNSLKRTIQGNPKVAMAPRRANGAPTLPTVLVPPEPEPLPPAAALPPAWHAVLAVSLTPFLGSAHATQFADELQGFLQSGLSIEAYDQAVFGPPLPPALPHSSQASDQAVFGPTHTPDRPPPSHALLGPPLPPAAPGLMQTSHFGVVGGALPNGGGGASQGGGEVVAGTGQLGMRQPDQDPQSQRGSDSVWDLPQADLECVPPQSGLPRRTRAESLGMAAEEQGEEEEGEEGEECELTREQEEDDGLSWGVGVHDLVGHEAC